MRLDSSSESSVTCVLITRYTLWQRLSTMGRWVVTMQVSSFETNLILFSWKTILYQPLNVIEIYSKNDVNSYNNIWFPMIQ